MSWNEYQFFTTDHITVPLPEGHRFPMDKYRKLRESLIDNKIISPAQLHQAQPVDDSDLLRAHSSTYVDGLKMDLLPVKETRPIGLPVGDALLTRSYVSVGGFVAATLSALETGFSALLAGGTHHAHSDRGEGFCVFNDFAVAAHKLISEQKVRRILILDLDVHQGNGNSSILGKRDDVFVASIHGEKNYPFRKVPSHLDVALPEKTNDDQYLTALEKTLSRVAQEDFDMIFYQAGVDILKYDSLGTFAISFEGVKARDKMVFEFSRRFSVATAMATGGGYSKPIENTVTAHTGTFEMARKVLG